MWIKNKFDKYIDCEFTYRHKDSEKIDRLNYEGAYKETGRIECSHCGKILKKGHVVHTFDLYDENGKTGEFGSYQFGSECVKYVFGAGLSTKESQ